MKINIGIDERSRTETAAGLCRLLAETYTLYLKTQKYHWNVTGPQFQSLHLMFEGQYQELALATDAIAERIRALGVYAPATFGEFTELSTIKEERGVPTSDAMITNLTNGHETLARTARHLFSQAEKADDASTADLATARMNIHEKSAWMLRSLFVDQKINEL